MIFFVHGRRIYAQLQGIIEFINRSPVSDSQKGKPRIVDTTAVPDLIDNWYNGFIDSSLKCCEGDFSRAEDFMNCGVYEFYYRLKARERYVTWVNDNIKRNNSS